MNCTQCQDSIFEYVDGTLDMTVRQQIDNHLTACRDCSTALTGERNAMSRMALMLNPLVSGHHLTTDVQTRIVNSARAEALRPLQHNSGYFSSWVRQVAAAAAVMILLAGISARQWVTARTGNPLGNGARTTSFAETATNESFRCLPYACLSNKQDLCDGM